MSFSAEEEAQELALYLRGRGMTRSKQMIALASCAATLARMESVDAANAESYLAEVNSLMREIVGLSGGGQ